jgi:hypothetical protein
LLICCSVFCLVVVDEWLLSYINYLGIVLWAEIWFLVCLRGLFWLCRQRQADGVAGDVLETFVFAYEWSLSLFHLPLLSLLKNPNSSPVFNSEAGFGLVHGWKRRRKARKG